MKTTVFIRKREKLFKCVVLCLTSTLHLASGLLLASFRWIWNVTAVLGARLIKLETVVCLHPALGSTCWSFSKAYTTSYLCIWLQHWAPSSVRLFNLVATATGRALVTAVMMERSPTVRLHKTGHNFFHSVPNTLFPPVQRKRYYATLGNGGVVGPHQPHVDCEMDCCF